MATTGWGTRTGYEEGRLGWERRDLEPNDEDEGANIGRGTWRAMQKFRGHRTNRSIAGGVRKNNLRSVLQLKALAEEVEMEVKVSEEVQAEQSLDWTLRWQVMAEDIDVMKRVAQETDA